MWDGGYGQGRSREEPQLCRKTDLARTEVTTLREEIGRSTRRDGGSRAYAEAIHDCKAEKSIKFVWLISGSGKGTGGV